MLRTHLWILNSLWAVNCLPLADALLPRISLMGRDGEVLANIAMPRNRRPSRAHCHFHFDVYLIDYRVIVYVCAAIQESATLNCAAFGAAIFLADIYMAIGENEDATPSNKY